jgi:metal-sulfur cluster biosynthetic enzyme
MSEHEYDPSVGAGYQSPAESRAAPPAAEGMAAGEAPVVTEDQVKSALRRVKDPELNLNIIDLGLVYGITVEGRKVMLDMSLTSPACPSGPEIMTQAEQQLRALPGVEDVEVNLVWSPFWTPDRIEPRIRAYLGI